MREENGTIEKGSSCRVDGNCKRVNPINETGAGGTGSGEGVSSSPASSSLSSKNQGKSCKGCLYYSSTFKSNSRNPLCIGLSSSLPQGSPSNFFLIFLCIVTFLSCFSFANLIASTDFFFCFSSEHKFHKSNQDSLNLQLNMKTFFRVLVNFQQLIVSCSTENVEILVLENP